MEEINKRLKNIELWLDNMSDKNRETYSLLIKDDIDVIRKQLTLTDVGCSFCEEIPKDSFYLGQSCEQCNKPFRVVKAKQ